MKLLKSICILLLSLSFGYAQAQNSAAINTTITNYLAVKNALAANDGTAAEAKAKQLLASFNNLHADGANAALITKLQYDSRHIGEVNMIPHQREHFASLSDNFYALLKNLKSNKLTLYRQYCSMTKRYFITDVEKDRDPYMGMANCSKITATLPGTGK